MTGVWPWLQEMLGLPEDEEELHHFRCLHLAKTGQLVVTYAHLAFLAHDHSTMFSLPIVEVTAVTRCRAVDGIAESNNSIRLSISNGKRVQFDGFWDREVCLELLQAGGL